MAKTKKRATGGNGRLTKPPSQAMMRQQIVNATMELNAIVANVSLSRTRAIEKLFDERRDIDTECGFDKTLDIEQYKYMYERESVAARAVEVEARECWKVAPKVFEEDDPNTDTEFEEAWAKLGRSLSQGELELDGDLEEGEGGYFEDEENNPIWEYLQRADELSGVGHYGILLLGLDDGLDLKDEATYKDGQRLLFLRAFDESLCPITAYESDNTSPRYGKPTKYMVTFNDPANQASTVSATGLDTTSKEVHWTRVIHIADNLGSSEVIGVPRMRPVWNNLYNLRKLYGGSAEMYWQGAFPGLSFEQLPQFADIEPSDDMKEQIENYMNTLQRYLALEGFTAKSLAPQVVDPSPQIDKQIEAICTKKGIPKRIFMGSERGELASGQDDDTWNDRCAFRQNRYLTPRVIVPFVIRCIRLGILPRPTKFGVQWPDLQSTSDEEQMDNGLKMTEGIVKYIQGGGDGMIEPVTWLTEVWGWDQDRATSAVEATKEYMESEDQSMLHPEREEDDLDREGREADVEMKKAQVDAVKKQTAQGGNGDAKAAQG